MESPTASWSLSANAGSLDSLNVRTRCGTSPCLRQISRAVDHAKPTCYAMARSVQCVALPGGGECVSSTTSRTLLAGTGALPGGRVALRNNPPTPCCA